ncbi:MAG: toxic anion resistance protein [Deltaproteobacteria bacterium]|jgi:uncharacterized protein YaaN involved in tellurite resistance|nr:toxic anion resistance protein [Deltaproteobacteria bacterium]
MAEFSMTVFDPNEIAVAVANEDKPQTEEQQALQKQAEANANAIMEVDVSTVDNRRQIMTPIEEFGLKTMASSASKNQLLKVTVGNLAQAGEEGGVVSQGLMDLQKEIKDLDPSLVDFTKKGLFGRLFNPVRKYFDKYQKSENVIADILSSLDKGKTTLKNDNTTLELEQDNIRALSKRLTREIELGTKMDDVIAQNVAKAKAANQDPDKIRFIEEEILFPLRQRIMDLQQMLVVNHQGLISMEVITRNNKELIRGVDRAMNVTVSALRTSVMVAGALYNQKIVLKKIQALNQTTANIISATSTMLKEQGTEIQKQAMESTVSVDVLQKSFDDVLWSLDEISRYKQQALPKLKDTISKFQSLADQGEKAISRMERGRDFLTDSPPPQETVTQ